MSKKVSQFLVGRCVSVRHALAVAIGLEAAVIVQQIHYLTSDGQGGQNGTFFGGHYWMRKPIQYWQGHEFPWWSASTIKRHLGFLRKEGLIIASAEPGGPKPVGGAMWYRVDYDALDAYVSRKKPTCR